MDIVLARSAGYCMGVRRAIQMALEVADGEADTVYTYGPLIHNPQALEDLHTHGVVPLDSAAALPDRPIIIRAHGIPPGERARLAAGSSRLVDATCPKVATIQEKIADYSRQGCTVLIAGDADHPEVVGLVGYAEGHAHVVSCPADVDRLPPLQRVVLVAQTTQDQETFEAIRRRVEARYPEAEALETICQSTHRRQAEVRDIAPRVDALVVIGGRNSANTRRLAEIATGLGTPAHHVETAAELPVDELRGLRKVGVTAGASTPAWIIEEVVATLRGL